METGCRVKGQGAIIRGGWEGEAAVQTCLSSRAPEKPKSQQPLPRLGPNSRTSSPQIQHRATRGTCWSTHRGATRGCSRFRNPSGGKGGHTELQWDTKHLTSLSRQRSGYCLLTAKSLSSPSHTTRTVVILTPCYWASCKANG